MPLLHNTHPFVGRSNELANLREVVAHHQGLLVIGDAGVGKTALIDQFLAQRGRTHPEQRVVAFDDAEPDDLNGLNGVDIVVRIDEITSLQPELVGVLAKRCRNGELILIVTLRSRQKINDHLLRLWKDGHIGRFDLAPFGRADIAELLEQSLKGPISADLSWHVWQSTGGFPRFVNDFVEAAKQCGAITFQSGTWLLSGDAQASFSVLDVVNHVLDDLPPDQREAIELIALSEPVSLATLCRFIPPEVLDATLATGHAERITDTKTGQIMLRTKHHRFALSTRELIGPGRQRMLYERTFADARDDASVRSESHEHVLRKIEWALASGLRPSLSQLVAATNAAFVLDRRDETDRLASETLRLVANDDIRRVPILVQRAHARRLLGRANEAEHDLEAAHRLSCTAAYQSDDETRLSVAKARAELAYFGHGDLKRARAIMQEFVESACALEPAAQATVAMLLSYASDFAAIRVLDASATEGHGLPHGMTNELNAPRLFARAMTGDLTEAQQRATTFLTSALSQQTPSFTPWALQETQAALLMILIWSGAVTEVELLIEISDESASEGVHVDHAMRQLGWGIAHACRFDWNTARRQFEATVARLDVLDFSGWRPIARTWLAMVLAATGETDRATQTLAMARAEKPRASGIIMFDLRERWCRTAIALGQGDANELARSLIDDGRDKDLPLVELWGWHALAMTGSLQHIEWRDRRATLQPLGKVELLRARIDHIDALVEGDQPREHLAVKQLASMGHWIPARHAVSISLSRRQLQIATLAASGLSSKEIASRLTLSTRTIEAHLSHVYTKLDVHSRAELAAKLTVRGEQSSA